MRLDKWLWHTRFCPSRSRASLFVASGRVRVNGEPTRRPAANIRVGDILTFANKNEIISLEILTLPPARTNAALALAAYQIK